MGHIQSDSDYRATRLSIWSAEANCVGRGIALWIKYVDHSMLTLAPSGVSYTKY